MLNDVNLLLALTVENRIPLLLAKEGYELFLGEARIQFLYGELIRKNALETGHLAGELLELSDKPSGLGTASRLHGIRLKRVPPDNLNIGKSEKYALGVSHNQLEHLTDLEAVTQAFNFLAKHSAYGMVHQIHASNNHFFDWDPTHNLRLTTKEWVEFCKEWAEQNPGWKYLGWHEGAPGRPGNHVFGQEIEGHNSLSSYKHYNDQFYRRVTAELTVANAISLARIPLLTGSFKIEKSHPNIFRVGLAFNHSLDAADGFAARHDFGQSPLGPFVDIGVDYLVQALTKRYYAKQGYIPKYAVWVLGLRNASTGFIRVYNAWEAGLENPKAHPHEAFGTDDRLGKVGYELTKTVGDISISINPALGEDITAAEITMSYARAIPVWTSPTGKRLARKVWEYISKKG